MCTDQIAQINRFGNDHKLKELYYERLDFEHKLKLHGEKQASLERQFVQQQSDTQAPTNDDMTFTEKVAREMHRIDRMKSIKYEPEDLFRFEKIDFLMLVDLLSKPSKSRLCGCELPLVTTCFFKPAPKPHQRRTGGKEDKTQSAKEYSKGNVRVKAISCQQDHTERTQRGCLGIVKQNMGPLEFKTFIKQQLHDRNKQIIAMLTKQKQMHTNDQATIFYEVQ